MTLWRRNVVIGAVAATWITLLIFTYLLVQSAKLKRNVINSSVPTPVKRQATDSDRSNLLINKSELSKSAKNFTYRLKSPVMCNIDAAPASIYVYDLKNHWTIEDARALAQDYGLRSAPHIVPTSTNALLYFFTTSDNTAAFSVNERSGIYNYHAASTAQGAVLDQGALRDKSNTFIVAHKLNDMIAPPIAGTTDSRSSHFIYKSVLDSGLNLVDEAGVKTTIGKSICTIPASAGAGQIQVEERNDGKITNVVNGTRTILGAYKVSRLSLEDAINEYQSAQPIDPIVIPAVSTVQSGLVSIDSAILAYYDLGVNFGQSLYAPVYITRGTVGDAQVYAFFPAVSASELLKKDLIKL